MRRRIPADAFAYYQGLGPGRTYAAVAKHFRVSVRGVTKRALKEGWQARLSQIEEQARRKADEKAADSLAAVNDRHLKTLRLIQAKALQALQGMSLGSAIDAVRALDLSIKHERVILGEPSERTEVAVEETIRREYQRWMIQGGGDAE